MTMENNKQVFWLFALTLVPLLSSCQSIKDCTITGHLWDNDTFNQHYEPAPGANVKLFSRADGKDVLVLYDEEREKTGARRRRAYFLLENQRKTEHLKKPRFVPVETSRGLEPIPIEKHAPGDATPERYGELVDGYGLKLFGPDALSGEYKLPVYRDKFTEAEQVLLTPAAVAADATVAGAVVGVIAAYCYAGGAYPYSPPNYPESDAERTCR